MQFVVKLDEEVVHGLRGLVGRLGEVGVKFVEVLMGPQCGAE